MGNCVLKLTAYFLFLRKRLHSPKRVECLFVIGKKIITRLFLSAKVKSKCSSKIKYLQDFEGQICSALKKFFF